MRPKLLLPAAAFGALLALAGPALAGNGGFAPVPPESPNAEGITSSYWFITGFILAIFVLVEGLLVLFVLRYRRRRRARDADGAQVHGSTRLETMWTVGPVLVLVAIAAFVLVKLPGIRDIPSASAAERVEVEVSGRQFYWQFRYANGVVAIDRLRAPAGRVVRLEVSAPEWDVIHSWWIPALGGKLDAIPGRTNVTWFQAGRPGVYLGQCAELCGLYHTRMLAEVEVLPAAEFDRWLEQEASAQRAGTSRLGAEEWRGVCAKCHGPQGEGGYGPRLDTSTLTLDPAAVERIVREGSPNGRMPPVGRDWTGTQVEALNGYLQEEFGGGAG